MIIQEIEKYITEGNKEELKNIFDDDKLDCNIILSSNQTPLIKCVIHNHYVLVSYFLKKDVFIDFQDKLGMTALMYAARKGFFTIVKLLTFYNANPNLKNKNGETALNIAEKMGNSMCKDILSIHVKAAEKGRDKKNQDLYKKYKGIDSKKEPDTNTNLDNSLQRIADIYNIFLSKRNIGTQTDNSITQFDKKNPRLSKIYKIIKHLKK